MRCRCRPLPAGALDAFFNSLMSTNASGTPLAIQLQHMREVTARSALMQV